MKDTDITFGIIWIMGVITALVITVFLCKILALTDKIMDKPIEVILYER